MEKVRIRFKPVSQNSPKQAVRGVCRGAVASASITSLHFFTIISYHSSLPPSVRQIMAEAAANKPNVECFFHEPTFTCTFVSSFPCSSPPPQPWDDVGGC